MHILSLSISWCLKTKRLILWDLGEIFPPATQDWHIPMPCPLVELQPKPSPYHLVVAGVPGLRGAALDYVTMSITSEKVEGTHPNIRLTNSLWRNSLRLGGLGVLRVCSSCMLKLSYFRRCLAMRCWHRKGMCHRFELHLDCEGTGGMGGFKGITEHSRCLSTWPPSPPNRHRTSDGLIGFTLWTLQETNQSGVKPQQLDNLGADFIWGNP